MSYVVLARKWRPQSFEDLVGQEHVSTTIGNAIAQNRVAHAFLFTGVRGVGKTTSARILAKALNCAQGPTVKPCQVCPQCTEITAGRDIDVQEIDGASYTGIDDVRRLQSNLGPLPARDRFKIFIVDEVHMLSMNAWNAFLKTLEEPPPHVKFIFATTEAHKIPVTILSRCQRYDFKLITAQRIAERLRWVLEQERVPADNAAVTTIAREAAGSMRDAMSLLDQVIAWVGVDGDKLTGEGVSRVLGVADRVVLHRLADAVVAGDASTSVRIVGDLAREGYDLPHVARDFLAHLRDLVIAKVAQDPGPLLDLADEELADVCASAARAGADDLTRLHQGFSKSFDDIVRSGQPRASLEMTLVRLARRPPLLPIDELLRRLGDLERRLGGGGGGGGGGPAPAAGGGSNRGAPVPQGGGAPPRRAMSAAPFEGAAIAAPPAPAVAPPQPMPPAAPAPGVARMENPRPPVVPPAPVAAPLPPPQPVIPPTVVAAPPPPIATSAPPQPANGAATNGSAHPSTPPPSGAPRRPSNLPVVAAPTGVWSGSSDDLAGWRAVLGLVRAKRPALASVLEHAALLRFGADRVELGYEASSFLVGQATDAAAKELLAGSLRTHFGSAPELVFETTAAKTGAFTVAQADTAERRGKLDAAKRGVAEHPLVMAAIELLGAELRDVRLAGDGEGGEARG